MIAFSIKWGPEQVILKTADNFEISTDKTADKYMNITTRQDTFQYISTFMRKRLSDMKCTVMIRRSWVRILVRSNLGCVVLLS